MSAEKKNGHHRHIAPRLRSGDHRIYNGGALPPHIKRGLQMIAANRGESVSWVLEQIIYEYFGFRTPQFVGLRTAESVSHDAASYQKIVRTIK